jgi:hypothetical protein
MEHVDMETEQLLNHAQTFASGFITELFNDGIIKDVDYKQLKKWFANPDAYQKELEKLAEYYYISNGEIFQLFDMAKVLPSLNYKLKAFDKDSNYEKNSVNLNKVMHKVKHKNLTRDMLSQLVSTGTMCGIWVGTKKKPYFLLFDDLRYAFPSHREMGEWVVAISMEWFAKMDDIQRQAMFANLYPYVTEEIFNKYKSNRDKYEYVYLPKEKTAAIRTHALKRSQNLGVNWATQGLLDILHKKKLRDLEKAVANKIINAVAVLTIGDATKLPENTNLKLPPALKKKVHTGVKNALEKSSTDGITVVSIPDFASLDFPDIKSGDSLDPKKFESVNNDIMSSYGLSPATMSGTGGNYASAKINVDVFYKRLAVLLEDIETEVYGKLFNWVLPNGQSDNFVLEYDKEPPITNKEKIDILMKLHTQEGFSLKSIVDSLSGVDFNEYVEQSIHEQEVLKLQEKIKPYASAYTSTGNEDAGRNPIENPENENTEKSKENDGNDLPS